MGEFDDPVFDAVAEKMEGQKEKRRNEKIKESFVDPAAIGTIKDLKKHLCVNAVPHGSAGMPKVSACKSCESACGYGKRLIELVREINERRKKEPGPPTQKPGPAPQADTEDGRISIRMTRSQAINVAVFIEMYLIEAIRNDTDIDNVAWIEDMIAAMRAMNAAAKETEATA